MNQLWQSHRVPEVGADEPIRNLATDVLRRWAENSPEPVVPEYQVFS
jgi:hypothetical protein